MIKKANGKVEMKTLDTFMKEGDEDAQCKKLEQVNVEVPARMGVSKAILENVIFVHQDESNWRAALAPRRFDGAVSRVTAKIRVVFHGRK